MEDTLRNEMSKEQLVHMGVRFLRPNDLSFFGELEEKGPERLAAAVRNRGEG
jgi:hypothetical protein